MQGADNVSIEVGDEVAVSQWLRAMSLTGVRDGRLLLARAISPPAAGGKQVPLVLPPPDSPESAAIATLLRAGQVPTRPAVDQAIRGIEGRRRREAIVADWLPQLDLLGQCLAEQVDEYWRCYGCGPTWAEVLESPATSAFVCSRALPLLRDPRTRSPLMWHLMRAGWLASNEAPRSLCAGPTYHAGRHGKARRISSREVGIRVAQAIGEFRYHRHKSPTWHQLAMRTYDGRGQRVFVDGADAEAQSLWLLTQRWIRIEDGEVRRGPAAKQVTRLKVEARKQRRETANEAPGDFELA